jgi:hypothetical protein
MIRQVRIAASVTGRQTNLEPRAISTHVNLGSYRRFWSVLKEWTLELAHEEIRELTHENPRVILALDVSAEDQEPERRDDNGGAKPQLRRVDVQACAKGDQAWSNEIQDRARNVDILDRERIRDTLDGERISGRRRTGGWFDLPRGLAADDLTGRFAAYDLTRRLGADYLARVQRAWFDHLLPDAGAPSGANPVVLGLGNGPAREVYDVEPGLILVGSVAGNALRKSRRGVTALNRVARERLRERRTRARCERQDDRRCDPRTPHPFNLMTSRCFES